MARSTVLLDDEIRKLLEHFRPEFRGLTPSAVLNVLVREAIAIASDVKPVKESDPTLSYLAVGDYIRWLIRAEGHRQNQPVLPSVFPTVTHPLKQENSDVEPSPVKPRPESSGA